MYRNFIENKPVGMEARSIASGLAPPSAGASSDITPRIKFTQHACTYLDQVCLVRVYLRPSGALPYELCRRYVEEVVLVTEEELKEAVSTLYGAGLVVEPAGCAAFAAVVNNRIPDVEGRRVVVILSGGNIGREELAGFPG